MTQEQTPKEAVTIYSVTDAELDDMTRDEIEELLYESTKKIIREKKEEYLYLFKDPSDKEIRKKTTLLYKIYLPLLEIVDDAVCYTPLAEYAKSQFKYPSVEVLNFSSEDVYDYLCQEEIDYQHHINRKSVLTVLHHYYPTTIQFESLRRLFESKDKIEFCTKLAEIGNLDIYALCAFCTDLKKRLRLARRKIGYSRTILRHPNSLEAIKEMCKLLCEFRYAFIESKTVKLASIMEDVKDVGICKIDKYEQLKRNKCFPSADMINAKRENIGHKYKYLFNSDLEVEFADDLAKIITKFYKGSLKGKNKKKVEASYQYEVIRRLQENAKILLAQELINEKEKKKMHLAMTEFINNQMDSIDNIVYGGSYNNPESLLSEIKAKAVGADLRKRNDYKSFVEKFNSLMEKISEYNEKKQ